MDTARAKPQIPSLRSFYQSPTKADGWTGWKAYFAQQKQVRDANWACQ